jgi:hypothetical protein
MRVFRLAFAFAISLTGVLALAQSPAQNAPIKPSPGNERLRVETYSSSSVDTASFKPAIDRTYREMEREPENPTWPGWMFAKFAPNGLPVGRATLNVPHQVGTRFPAIDATGWVPPDPSLAVGKNHVVVVVNSSIGFFQRNGTQDFQQTFQTFFSGLGAGNFLFDPKAFYDRATNRYFVTCLEQSGSPRTSKVLVAVSDDDNPNGTWHRYRLDSLLVLNGSEFWLDYPGFGYNKDAVVATGNMFGFNGGFAGVYFLLVPKAPMLSGAPVTVRYLLDQNAATAQVTQNWSTTETRVFAINRQNTAFVKIHSIENPAGPNPALSSAFVPIPNFDWPGSNAASTPGQLDILDTRFYNVNQRGSRLTVAHAVGHNGGLQNKVRWYEFDVAPWPASAPTLVQSGEIAPSTPGEHFHMPAIGQNASGEISAIYTRSSASIPADLVISSRRSGDPLGFLSQPFLLQTSEANGYGGAGVNRWGDYFDVNIDPLDDKTFWGVGMAAGPSRNWRTHVFSWTVRPIVPVKSVEITPTVALSAVDKVTIRLTLDRVAPEPIDFTIAASDPLAIPTVTGQVPTGKNYVDVNIPTKPVSVVTEVDLFASTPGTQAKTTHIRLLPRALETKVKLSVWRGGFAGRQVTLELRAVGGGAVAETFTVGLSELGNIRVYPKEPGLYNVLVSTPGFLRKAVPIVMTPSGRIKLDIVLINGDVDRNNVVNNADLARVEASMKSRGGAADVDGDGIVTTKDTAIVRRSLGKRGDN